MPAAHADSTVAPDSQASPFRRHQLPRDPVSRAPASTNGAAQITMSCAPTPTSPDRRNSCQNGGYSRPGEAPSIDSAWSDVRLKCGSWIRRPSPGTARPPPSARPPSRACGTAPSVSGPAALGLLRRQAVRPRSARRTVTGWSWPGGALT